MLYPVNIEQKLGFDQIRLLLKQECQSTLGQAYVDKMKFSTDQDLVVKLITQSYEFKKILELHLNFPNENFIDATYYLSKIKPEGSFLDGEELKDIKLSLHTVNACIEFLDKQALEFPTLYTLRKEIELDASIYHKVNAMIDDDGKVRDNASPALIDIRKTLTQEQNSLRREVDRILKSVKKEGYADESVTPTIRNGRMVIPLFSEYKRKIKGFIHDESATGQTAFIEPSEVFEINNSIRELELKEKREIIRILTELTSYIRPHIPLLKKAYTFLGLIDFIRAKARLSVQLAAAKPLIENKPIVKWYNAKHPLLLHSFSKQNKKVVPLTIVLDEQDHQRILLISGPNAGGKSVCLKTVGIIQYMFQCGLLVPMDEHSVMGFFQDVFIDIGDEQSIENDLSTYSAHLGNMKYFTNMAGKKTLILIDEFGTGTEPQAGAAIAEAVLDELNRLKVFGVITTHYSNLKAYADKTDGLVNAAMVFNVDSLEPLYILDIGKPGSSYAFEIAGKIGLNTSIISRSKQILGTSQVKLDDLLKDLEKEKVRFNQLNKELTDKEKKVSTTLEEYTELKNTIDANKKVLLKEAKEQAKQLLVEANKKIESTIREIKENQADKELTRISRNDLEKFKEELIPEVQPEKPVYPEEKETGELKEGDYCRIKDTGTIGEVLFIKGKEVEVMIGELRSNIKLNRLEKISRKEYKLQLGETYTPSFSKGINMIEKSSEFSPNIDLRGKRGEEALAEVDSLLDNALLLGVSDLRIVHGKGDGILKTLIRAHLKNYKQVQSTKDEHADRGGAGVTVVKLK